MHLLCALYNPSISFGDVDYLTAVSWQELDYKSFGRKPCMGCQDQMEMRTGVTIQCEAGLCKNYYHISCAQRSISILLDYSMRFIFLDMAY